MIPRILLQKQIHKSIRENPITALLGPRQCGKTTIAKTIASDQKSTFFDLENPADHSSLSHSPMLRFESLEGLIILDEIQRIPELFPILRVVADQKNTNRKILILGSASPGLMKNASETLAGRISFIDMTGFSLLEIGYENWKKLWLRGFFPLSYLGSNNEASSNWRENFIRTFLERDIPQMGINIPSSALRRFWTMTAHYHGQVWNGSEFARSMGVTEPTARKYIDILTGAYVVRQLQPWHENIRKRQVKSPKVFIRDPGILHSLLSLPGESILSHPKLGASWEGFVIEEILEITRCQDAYFWGTHAGAELDLMIFKNGKRIGFEVKYSDAPKRTRSMLTALQDLGLHHLYVVSPGTQSYPLDKKITVIGIRQLSEILSG